MRNLPKINKEMITTENYTKSKELIDLNFDFNMHLIEYLSDNTNMTVDEATEIMSKLHKYQDKQLEIIAK